MNSKQPTAGIILAAGMSRRFGYPKQLIKIKGRTFIERIVDASLGSKLGRIALVLGHGFVDTVRALAHRTDNPRLHIVENSDYRDGMSRSLHLGLKLVQHDHPSVMFLLADQPLVRSETIDFLLESFWISEMDICVPVCQGRKGNPTIFSRHFYNQLLDIEGDVGARGIIRNHPNHVLNLETDDPSFFFDIDTPADLERLNTMPFYKRELSFGANELKSRVRDKADE
jgi:molybdenum cofactor cytidylyltransferase